MFVTLGWFLLSAVLIGLGAFFCRGVLIMLPVWIVVGVAVLMGQAEIAVGVVLGTVAVNTAIIGLGSLLFNVSLTREHWAQVGLTLIGLLAILVTTAFGEMGCFAGCGLVLVGLVANRVHKQKICGRLWLKLLVGVLILFVGAFVFFWQRNLITTFFGMPDGRWAMVILAPLVVIAWIVACNKKCVEKYSCLQVLSTSNALLVTVGCGVMAVLGQLQFSQVVRVVVLPWLTLMILILGVMLFVPKKTTRWWGGLLVLMYVGLLTSLIW